MSSEPSGHAAPGGPALRDAATIAARVADDERVANAARARYRVAPMPALEPDGLILPLLEPSEAVLARRSSVVFDRRQATPGPAGAPGALRLGLGGELYLTSRRLVLVGRVTLSLALLDIDDVVLSAERVLLVMRDGTGVALELDRPRLLRVEIAAARAAARR